MSKILITMESGELMEAELYPDLAPITVENFLKLIEDIKELSLLEVISTDTYCI